eukprot:SAG11_NODE_18309_length_494_cov_4.311392_1_plen_59_part_01
MAYCNYNHVEPYMYSNYGPNGVLLQPSYGPNQVVQSAQLKLLIYTCARGASRTNVRARP